MDKKGHHRSSSHGRKLQTNASRPTRPGGPHRRQLSYNNALNHGSSSNVKQVLGANKKAGVEILSGDEDETGMASFLQFCATCEKQIVTPGSSILYCSESCRRKDSTKRESYHALYSPTALSQPTSYFDSPPTEILPQRSPTVLRPLSTASDISIPEDGSLDSLESPSRSSEALRFLSQLHTQDSPPPRRPNRYSNGTSESGLPSLINTPSSSVGTPATSYSYHHRPLPKRHDPLTCRCYHRKSVDLVIPTFPASPPAAAAAAAAAASASLQDGKNNSVDSSASTIRPTAASTDSIDFAFHKRRSTQPRSESRGSGSLKQLFSHDAMQAQPDHAW